MKAELGSQNISGKLRKILDAAPRRYKLEAYIPLACQVFAEYPKASRDKWADELSLRIQNDPALVNNPEDPPSPRTMGNWHEDIYKKLTPEERQGFDVYQWPDSHQNGSLPWGASTIGMELARFYNDKGREQDPPITLRVPISQVRWAHYLQMAAPDLPLFTTEEDALGWCVESLSWDLAQMENLGGNSDGYIRALWPLKLPVEEQATFREVVADYLLWKPWVDQNHHRRYRELSQVQERGPIALIAHFHSDDGDPAAFTMRSLKPYMSFGKVTTQVHAIYKPQEEASHGDDAKE